MPNPFAELLVHVEHLRDGVLTPRDARDWPHEWLEEIGILVKHREADEIVYDGCDRECAIPNRGFERLPDDSDRLVCVYRCVYGCGRVLFEPRDFAQWRFSLTGLAGAVARAIGASGVVVEDVPGRLVEVGRVKEGESWRDLFLARGLAWDDAPTALADARRLKASGAPLVLGLAVLPQKPVWADCKPATALLSDIASFDDRLTVKLSSAFGRPTKPHPDAVGSEWLTVTEAANRLVKEDVVDDLDLTLAKGYVSNAATRGPLVSNGKKGRDRRVESGSLASWMLQLRQQNLAEDDNAPRRRRRRG